MNLWKEFYVLGSELIVPYAGIHSPFTKTNLFCLG
jgi:hypothetical protein